MSKDLILESARNLKREGFKTILTLLGVIIGIAAIVSMVSIGSGLGVAIEEQLAELGGETIFIIPGGVQNIRTEISNNDVEWMRKVSGVKNVVPIYTKAAVMEYNGEKINVSVNATSGDDSELFEGTGFFDVSEGREFTGNESTSILIGDEIANNYFEKKINIRKQIKIDGKNYKVIGILAPQPQSFGGGPDTGNTVFMSLKALERIDDAKNPSIIFATAESKENVNEVSDEFDEYFEDKYGEGAVNISSTDEILESVNGLLGIITIFITGIAGISLIVGGIGIMNAMITSVLERTKEIGLYKAIGATNNKILALFLLEAAFIGLVGGIIGIVLGVGLAEIIAFIGTASGFALDAVINAEIILGGLGFSMIIGMGSGFYPALRASKLDPVDALRYE